jgi:hypothetical protein
LPQRKDATSNLVNKASESKASESKVSRSKISPTNPLHQKFFALIGFPDMSPVYSGQRINNELPEIVVFLIMWHTKASILRALQVALGVFVN